MEIRPFILLLAFALSACDPGPSDSPAPATRSEFFEWREFNSYRGIAYEEGKRLVVQVMAYSNGDSDFAELLVQEADSSVALIEWRAKSGNIGIETLGPGAEKVVLRDVRYERYIGVGGAVFPEGPLELRLTRILGDTIRLEIPSPSGLPSPLPLRNGSLPLIKDIYVD